MLEFVYFTNRVKYEKLYEEIINGNDFSDGCMAGYYLNQGNQFGFVTSTVSAYSEELKKRLVGREHFMPLDLLESQLELLEEPKRALYLEV